MFWFMYLLAGVATAYREYKNNKKENTGYTPYTYLAVSIFIWPAILIIRSIK